MLILVIKIKVIVFLFGTSPVVGQLPRQKRRTGSVWRANIYQYMHPGPNHNPTRSPTPTPTPTLSLTTTRSPANALQTNIVTYVEGEVPCRVVESGKAATGKATAKQTYT